MNKVNINQLFDKETSTFTYIISDPQGGEAAIIDPVEGQVQRDLDFLKNHKLKLKLILETHMHADHVTGATLLKKKTGANIGVSALANTIGHDLLLNDDDKVPLGSLYIISIATPGHTNSCLSYLCEGNIFTGDTLLINGCGRTDFQGGSSENLFNSVREKLFRLPDETVVYPAHDYKGYLSSTLGIEKKNNQRLGLHISKEEFIIIMTNLKLTPPAHMKENLPLNLRCGTSPGKS